MVTEIREWKKILKCQSFDIYNTIRYYRDIVSRLYRVANETADFVDDDNLIRTSTRYVDAVEDRVR